MSGSSLAPVGTAKNARLGCGRSDLRTMTNTVKFATNIERLVMHPVLELRREFQEPKFKGQGSGRVELFDPFYVVLLAAG